MPARLGRTRALQTQLEAGSERGGDYSLAQATSIQATGAAASLPNQALPQTPGGLNHKAASTEFFVTTVEHLHGVLTGLNCPDPILLLGGGASVRSGIPTSAELVERIGKWAFCRNQARHSNDPAVRRSDWLPWLQQQPWYRKSANPAERFAAVCERLLQPREARLEFLRGVVTPGVPPSTGYERLADLLAVGAIRTVLLALFDPVLANLCGARNRPHHVEVIRGPDDYGKISTSPRYPQLIYLYGDVERYADRNLPDDGQGLDSTLVFQLAPMLRDHPLVVFGYGGAESSIMRQLLIHQAETTKDFRHGVFWCEIASLVPHGLHPQVRELGAVIGSNLQLVPIEGFDDVFDRMPAAYLERMANAAPSTRDVADAALTSPTGDMQILPGVADDEFDWVRVQTHLIEYCRRIEVEVPARVTKGWLTETLCCFDLARSATGGKITPTVAGYLLFGRRPQDRIPQCGVTVSVDGEEEVQLVGNLWTLLERITAVLEEHNVPFLLKGAVSEQVYPYPPLAFRELVVNALVHRTYEGSEPVRIKIGAASIDIISPGGLVDPVRDALGREGREIQQRIEAGARGLKGYRNPVIADLFYGAGVMEKAGSGLADVQLLVKEGGGKVVFGPTPANDRFDVTVYCRPEAMNAAAGTATPLVSTARFVSNLLEVVQLPPLVWHATTWARKAREIWKATGAENLPPFILHDGRLFGFSNPGTATHPLREQIDRGSLESMETDEFVSMPGGKKRLVWLLHEALYRHLEGRELAVQKKRKRAYFTRTEEGERVIKYRATVREATRRVAKPVLSRTGDRVRYWEHKAIRFGFERYASSWALQIVPSYAFTVDGYRNLVYGPRVSSLATRRSSHDYNMQVYNDLVFWAWVLAAGQDAIAIDSGGTTDLILRSAYASYELRDVSPTAAAEADESEVSGLTLEELEDRVAEEADRERSDVEGCED